MTACSVARPLFCWSFHPRRSSASFWLQAWGHGIQWPRFVDFFPQIALAVGVLTSNRRGGLGTNFGGLDVGCHFALRFFWPGGISGLLMALVCSSLSCCKRSVDEFYVSES